MKQLLITPAMGKRLIAKTIANHPAVRKALRNGTVVIVAGTTNGYVAEEILRTYKIEVTSQEDTSSEVLRYHPTKPSPMKGA